MSQNSLTVYKLDYGLICFVINASLFSVVHLVYFCHFASLEIPKMWILQIFSV